MLTSELVVWVNTRAAVWKSVCLETFDVSLGQKHINSASYLLFVKLLLYISKDARHTVKKIKGMGSVSNRWYASHLRS